MNNQFSYNYLVQILLFLIILALIILPLFPLQVDPLITYSIIALGILNTLPWLFGRKQHFKWYKGKNLFFILFLISAGVSAIFSQDQNLSLIIFALYCSYFVIFNQSGNVFYSFKQKNLLALIFISVVLALTLVSAYSVLITHQVNKDILGVSFLWVYYGHNHLSSLQIFAIPLAVYFFYQNRANAKLKPVTVLLCLILICGLLFSFSRGSVLALNMAMILTLSIFKLVSKKTLGIIILLSIIFISFYLSSLNQLGGFFDVKRIGWGEGGRAVYWEISVWNGLTHPITGSGLDTVRLLPPPKDLIRSDYSHNFFIQLFSDGGYPLFISGLALIIVLFFNLYTKISLLNRRSEYFFFSLAVWTGTLASLFNSLVDFDWHLPVVFMVFWLLSGIIYDKDKNDSS